MDTHLSWIGETIDAFVPLEIEGWLTREDLLGETWSTKPS